MSNVNSHMQVLRWVLVVPLGIAGVLLGFAAAIALLGLANSACPPESLISGMCTAGWYPTAESFALCSGAALGAFATVTMPSAVAPTFKPQVAAAALLMGAAYALWFAAEAGAAVLAPLAAALIAGTAALGGVLLRSRALPDSSFKQMPDGAA